METIQDFEDLLALLEKHHVRYLIIGGLAVIFHAKPRYTKDMDIWLDPSKGNLERANRALAEFGIPFLLESGHEEEILQLGVAPDRIDLLLQVKGARFETAWRKRILGNYGKARANWVDIDSLIRIKKGIASPRHQEDVRVLQDVKAAEKERRRVRSKERRKSPG
jgi:hypothetical protein